MTLEDEKTEVAYLVGDLFYQLALGMHTVGNCRSKACAASGGGARGGRYCKKCIQHRLGTHVGNEAARAFVESAILSKEREAALVDSGACEEQVIRLRHALVASTKLLCGLDDYIKKNRRSRKRS